MVFLQLHEMLKSTYYKRRSEYKLKRCSNKECCKQCKYVKFNGTMTKWPVQKLTHRTIQKHVQHHDATGIRKIIFLCFSDFPFFFSFFIYYFLEYILQQLSNMHLFTVFFNVVFCVWYSFLRVLFISFSSYMNNTLYINDNYVLYTFHMLKSWFAIK